MSRVRICKRWHCSGPRDNINNNAVRRISLSFQVKTCNSIVIITKFEQLYKQGTLLKTIKRSMGYFEGGQSVMASLCPD